VCIHLYVDIDIDVHVCRETDVCIYIYTSVCARVCMFILWRKIYKVRKSSLIWACSLLYLHRYRCTCLCKDMHLYKSICVCVCLCVCVWCVFKCWKVINCMHKSVTDVGIFICMYIYMNVTERYGCK